MNELNLINNLPLDNDLRLVKIGDGVAPIEISNNKVRIKNLDVIDTLNVAGQDDNLIDREGTNTFVKNTGDSFGIGTTTPEATLHISDTLAGSGVNASVKIETTSDDSGTSPELWLERVSTTPADNDYVGMIRFYGTNSDQDDGAGTEAQHQFGAIYVQVTDITTSSEDTKMYFNTYKAGGSTSVVIDKGDVGIGNTAPAYPLDVTGDTRIGWHGYSGVIKVLPSDFMVNDDYSRAPNWIEDDTADTLGFRVAHTDSEAYAFVAIPNGYTATHVQVHASASTSNGAQCKTFTYQDGSTADLETFDLNSNQNITDVVGASDRDLVIKYMGLSTTVIVYGATVTIAPS